MHRRSEFEPLFRLAGRDLVLQHDFDLTSRTSMRMHTTAAVFAEVNSPLAMRKLMKRAREIGCPTYILGGGRNTLFASSYFEGLVVALGKNFRRIEPLGKNCVRAGAGSSLTNLIKTSRDANLMGLEFLTMVPGTVGGSLAGNAGAGNWGLCDFVERVYLMTRDGFVASVGRNQFRYAYRFSELREAIVLEADFRLEPLDRVECERRVSEFKEKKRNQPYDLPSSGCIFKNPRDPHGMMISAGKLIDECGLKGYSIRSAEVSQQHANFIINRGNSCGEDFLALITLVRDVVLARTGIQLNTEVQIVDGPLSSAVLA